MHPSQFQNLQASKRNKKVYGQSQFVHGNQERAFDVGRIIVEQKEEHIRIPHGIAYAMRFIDDAATQYRGRQSYSYAFDTGRSITDCYQGCYSLPIEKYSRYSLSATKHLLIECLNTEYRFHFPDRILKLRGNFRFNRTLKKQMIDEITKFVTSFHINGKPLYNINELYYFFDNHMNMFAGNKNDSELAVEY